MKKVILLFLILLATFSCQENNSKQSNIECNQEPEYFLLRPDIEKAFGYSHAVKICNQIKISGAVSMDNDANPIAIGDIEQQMKNSQSSTSKGRTLKLAKNVILYIYLRSML